MFRFIVALLLINSYSGSWGAPTHNVTIFLSMSLNELANSCESSFLSSQMRNRIQDCQVPVPPYQKKQIECLLFYDINRQLCEAVAAAKVALDEVDTTKMLAEQDVAQLCNSAKDWTFIDMGVVYNNTVNKLFHDPVKCTKFCVLDSDNLFSVDSSFYCKYFRWGADVLKSHMSVTNPQNKAESVAQTPNEKTAVINGKADKDIEVKEEITEKNLQPNKNTVNSATAKQLEATHSQNISSIAENVNTVNVEPIKKDDESATPDKQLELPEIKDTNLKSDDKVVVSQGNIAKVTNNQQQQVVPKDLILKDNSTSTVIPTGKNVKSKKGDVAGELIKEDFAESKNHKDLIPDDYQANNIDSEEGGLAEVQGDDDMDDPLEAKLDKERSRLPIKINEASIDNSDILPKETYSNTIPEFAEEDDHFFPFFLTAIIMVVLLYILYHNKNKVSKVVLGLIVEGRQPGRRRNSRGHAYRRLDTLEQAMSTNSAAPPSKIIY